MPVFVQEPGAGVNFDGLTATTGLILVGGTGSAAIQGRINSVSLHVTGTDAVTVALSLVDPDRALNRPLILAGAANTRDFFLQGMLLPTVLTSGTASGWGLSLVTTAIAGGNQGFFTIDYDFEQTEGA